MNLQVVVRLLKIYWGSTSALLPIMISALAFSIAQEGTLDMSVRRMSRSASMLCRGVLRSCATLPIRLCSCAISFSLAILLFSATSSSCWLVCLTAASKALPLTKETRFSRSIARIMSKNIMEYAIVHATNRSAT